MNENRPDFDELLYVANNEAARNLGVRLNEEVWYKPYASKTPRRGYIASYEYSNPYSLVVVSSECGSLHGNFTEYILPVNPASPPKQEKQSKKKNKLVMDALAAAEKRGYCAETRNVITDIGLQIPKTSITKKITIEVTGDGVDVEDKTFEELGLNVSSDNKFVTVKVVED